MAIGAIAELRAIGLRVSEDVAVAGFDDLPLTEFVTLPFMTVYLNRDQAGAEAVNLAIALAEDPTRDVPPVVLPVSLIRRKSAWVLDVELAENSRLTPTSALT